MDTSTEDSKVDSANDTKNESEEKAEDNDESMEVSKDESLDESKDEADGIPEKPRKKGTLEQPVEMRGKRERKKVERFVQETKKEEVVVEGKGTPLKDIPYIQAMIQKTSTEDLKLLHRLAYNRPGTATEIKRNIYKFKGFPFSREDKALEKKRTSLEKVVISELKKLLLVLGLERSGVKGDLVERIIDFLLDPHDTGKTISKSSRRSSAKRTAKAKAAKTPKSQQKKRPKESDSDDDSNDSDASEKKAPKKKAKTSSSPTDSEIKAFIKKLLDKADLEEVTMKKLCQQVYDNYPGQDLSHKKDFIKSTVKSTLFPKENCNFAFKEHAERAAIQAAAASRNSGDSYLLQELQYYHDETIIEKKE
ncbi:Protein DEK [Armadillidium nasatum]|uniref:Protein DEK n=1 Tax=Armadillidium nasatum TaxID=96803 RepID=A0A5N5TL32_9CRUS|nr:Protein DEK [Armadillidium nasatum]